MLTNTTPLLQAQPLVTTPLPTVIPPTSDNSQPLLTVPLWQSSPPLSSTLLPDQAGNTLATARDIGSLDQPQSFSDYVHVDVDANDFYRFTIAQTSRVNLSLTGTLSDGAYFEIIRDSNQDGAIDLSDYLVGYDNYPFASWYSPSANAGTITYELAAGTYFIQVEACQGGTDYTLNLSAAMPFVAPSDRADNTLATAHDLGILSDPQTFSDTLNLNFDANDYYRFTLDTFKRLTLSLTGFICDAKLIQDSNGNGSLDANEAIAISLTGTQVFDLAAGTYFVHVSQHRYFSPVNTSYRLDLSALTIEMPSDDTGNTLETAYQIGTVEPQQTFNALISRSNSGKYYQFTLNDFSYVSVSLNNPNLTKNPVLEIILDSNSNGVVDDEEIIASSSQNSNFWWDNWQQTISTNLSAGNYFVRVRQYDSGSDSHLRISSTPVTSWSDTMFDFMNTVSDEITTY